MTTFAEMSDTPSDNTTIGSVSIAEGAPPGNMNNAIRELMASCKNQDINKADASALVTLLNSIISTNAKVTGRGAVMHNNNSANTSGCVYIQALGTAAPTLANGDWLLEY